MSTSSDTANPPSAGWYATLKHSGASLLAIGKTRLELLALELKAEKQRLLKAVGLLLAALFAAGLAVVLAIATLLVLYWEQRLWVLGGALLLTTLLALLLLRAANTTLADKAGALALTMGELEADIAALRAAAEKTEHAAEHAAEHTTKPARPS